MAEQLRNAFVGKKCRHYGAGGSTNHQAPAGRHIDPGQGHQNFKLIDKIDEALVRIKEGSYGFCEETSEPIGLKRLEARPIATLSIEAQERHERSEKMRRDD